MRASTRWNSSRWLPPGRTGSRVRGDGRAAASEAAFARTQHPRALAEMGARRRLDPEDAFAPLRHIEIDFKLPPLRHHKIEPQGQRDFEPFAHVERPFQRNRFFTVCWVRVEPPRVGSPSSSSAASTIS